MRIRYALLPAILAIACSGGSGSGARDLPTADAPASDTVETDATEDASAGDTGSVPDVPGDVAVPFVSSTPLPPPDPDARPALTLAVVDVDEAAQTFAIEAAFEGPADVSGLAFNLAFDPAVVEPAGSDAREVLATGTGPQGVALGAFGDGRPVFSYGDALLREDQLNGTVAYYYKGPLALPTRTLTGRTVLARITFRAIAAGAFDLAFTAAGVSVRDGTFAPVPVARWGLALEVTP